MKTHLFGKLSSSTQNVLSAGEGNLLIGGSSENMDWTFSNGAVFNRNMRNGF